jgi:hypothetical protein
VLLFNILYDNLYTSHWKKIWCSVFSLTIWTLQNWLGNVIQQLVEGLNTIAITMEVIFNIRFGDVKLYTEIVWKFFLPHCEKRLSHIQYNISLYPRPPQLGIKNLLIIWFIRVYLISFEFNKERTNLDQYLVWQSACSHWNVIQYLVWKSIYPALSKEKFI